MILGIDASNIRAGGGLTHLIGILGNACPSLYGFKKVIIWGGNQLNQLPDKPWLEKVNVPELNKSFFHRLIWQKIKLSKLAIECCDILFSPAGNYTGRFHPFVSMSQNMLVFEGKERRRYLFTIIFVRLCLLRIVQGLSFKKADGVIFLSNYAKDYILRKLNTSVHFQIINHGISESFRTPPLKQKDISQYSKVTPFRLLYVSIIDLYKHQTILVQTIDKLHQEGFPIQLDLVGPAYPLYLRKLRKTIGKIKNGTSFINIYGNVSYDNMAEIYKKADAFVFSSSCENMPNIVVEAMSSGLPIASSNYGPMPEFLKEAAFYFDPLSVESTYNALKELIEDRSSRAVKANLAYQYSLNFSWEKCSNETFSFLSHIAMNYNVRNSRNSK